MEIISTQLFHSLDINKYFQGLNSCFIDIETTGLDRNRQLIYLIGLLFYDNKCGYWILNQYFSNEKNTEKTLLENFIKDIASFDNLISYNGDRFDIPFINHRLKLHNIKDLISLDNSYDLYKIIRANKQYLKLENLKLKTVEKSLGYYREDIYSGYDCIEFYYKYLKKRDPILKEKILKHNSDDLFYMLDVIEVLDVIHSKKTISIEVNKDIIDFTIDNIKIEKDIMYIDGSFNKELNNNIKSFSSHYNLSTDSFRRFNMGIYVKYGYISEEEKCTYIDSLDYPDSNLLNFTEYNIPSNIFILKAEKEIYLDNIKLLIKSILKNSI